MSELDQASALLRAVARFQEALRFASVPGPWLYEMPRDLEPLASRLHLSVQELAPFIEEGKIRTRRRVDKLGRRKGPVVVLIHDALEGFRGTPHRRPIGSPRT